MNERQRGREREGERERQTDRDRQTDAHTDREKQGRAAAMKRYSRRQKKTFPCNFKTETSRTWDEFGRVHYI